jgi:hypothetical protein
MDKVQKTAFTDYNASSSEPFRLHFPFVLHFSAPKVQKQNFYVFQRPDKPTKHRIQWKSQLPATYVTLNGNAFLRLESFLLQTMYSSHIKPTLKILHINRYNVTNSSFVYLWVIICWLYLCAECNDVRVRQDQWFLTLVPDPNLGHD